MDLKSIDSTVNDIGYYANQLGDAYQELWDSYIEVEKERDELLERVKELEAKYEN